MRILRSVPAGKQRQNGSGRRRFVRNMFAAERKFYMKNFKKKLKKSAMILVFILATACLTAGCGSQTDRQDDSGVGASTEDNRTTENTQVQDSGQTPDTSGDREDAAEDAGDVTKDAVEDAGDMTKDAVEDAGDVTKDAVEDAGDMTKDAVEDVGDAAKDLTDGAEDAADDVADGVGDAIDNLGGGSFDSYGEAKSYLLEKLKKDNAGADYEVREEKEELTAYNSNDPGAEGYAFSVYETDGNEKIGIYYVDKDTGKIYRYMGKNSIEAY